MPISMLRSSDALTSAAVKGEPSRKVTPSRRLKVHSVPSALDSQDVASMGINPFSGYHRVSVSYTLKPMLVSQASMKGGSAEGMSPGTA